MRNVFRLMALLCLTVFAIFVAAGCGDEPVARLNGTPITEGDFLDALERGEGLRSGPSTGKMVLSTILVQRLVEEDAREKGISVSDEEVDEAYQQAKERVESRNATQTFEELLEDMGTTPERVKKDLRFNLLLRKLTVTDTEVEQFFEERSGDLDAPEMRTFQQMFLATKAAAQEARKAVVEEGQSFTEMAQERSLKHGESTFPLPPGGISVEVAEGPISGVIADLDGILDGLEPGEVSEPIHVEATMPSRDRKAPPKTVEAWALVYLENRTPPLEATLENSRDEIARRVFSRKMATGEVNQYFDSLKAKARLEILDPTYSSLEEEFRELAQEMPEFKPPAPPEMLPEMPGTGGESPEGE